MSAAPDPFPERATGITFFVGLTLAALSLAAIMLWAGYSSLRRELTSYCNVRLNDSRDEVQYRLGYPPFVVGEPTIHFEAGTLNGHSLSQIVSTDPKNIYAMPADKGINDFKHWLYGVDYYPGGFHSTGLSVDVNFDKNGLVAEVACEYRAPVRARTCPPLFGISLDTSQENMVKTLGKPSRSTVAYGAKHVRYDELGLEFDLEKGSVVGLRLTRWEGGDLALLRSFVERVGRRLL